jgi:hypothetical protein
VSHGVLTDGAKLMLTVCAIGLLTAGVGVLIEPRSTDSRQTTLRPNRGRYGKLRAGGSQANSVRNRAGLLEKA